MIYLDINMDCNNYNGQLTLLINATMLLNESDNKYQVFYNPSAAALIILYISTNDQIYTTSTSTSSVVSSTQTTSQIETTTTAINNECSTALHSALVLPTQIIISSTDTNFQTGMIVTAIGGCLFGCCISIIVCGICWMVWRKRKTVIIKQGHYN